MAATKIEYVSHTMNPAHGCWGPGGTLEHPNRCRWCYAARFAKRHGSNPKSGGYYELAQEGVDPFTPALDLRKFERASAQLSNARKPRRVFLGSMTDVGGEWPWRLLGEDRMIHVGSEYAQELIRSFVEALPQHTFLLLTKNPGGLLEEWPSNAHVGVSCSIREEIEERVPALLERVQAGARWLSLEPLLDLGLRHPPSVVEQLDWVVLGAQTGPGAGLVPTITGWHIVRWCRAKGIPLFVKDNMIGETQSMEWPREYPQ